MLNPINLKHFLLRKQLMKQKTVPALTPMSKMEEIEGVEKSKKVDCTCFDVV